jgi:hypothetical protein
MSELTAWDSFYVIVGLAAGVLIGLQFVVMTLIAQRPDGGRRVPALHFAMPTIVHFGAALLFIGAVTRSMANDHPAAAFSHHHGTRPQRIETSSAPPPAAGLTTLTGSVGATL